MGMAIYKHELGNNLFLSSYSLDPSIGEDELRKFVSSRDGKARLNLEDITKDIRYVRRVDSFKELGITISRQSYEVPEQLKPYREALEAKLNAEGKFNGPIAVIDGRIRIPLRLCSGGFYDFQATKLDAIPGELLPDRYPKDRTIKELMDDYGLKFEQMARYLSFAFLLQPNHGEEISFVQRAKNLGIAPDCMALSGSTLRYTEDFLKPGFDFQKYYEEHIADELSEEYGLKKGEFKIDGLSLIDDRIIGDNHHILLKIETSCCTEALAQRVYGKEQTIKEHPILYSIKPEAINTLTKRFPIWPSSLFHLSMLDEERKASKK